VKGESLAGRDLISLLDFTTDELRRILELAAEVKANPGHFSSKLAGKTLFMYFEKPSLRTRVTFEAGMTQLGGHAIYYTAADGKIGVRESEDVARNLDRWVDGAMCRTFSHDMLKELARFTEIPIINGLTDHLHPCQALADFQSLQEVDGDSLEGRRLVYVGDGNNVANSLMNGGARLGVSVTVITPPGYAPADDVVETARSAAEQTGARIEVTEEMDAVRGADAIYTDVWASMGQEAEADDRKRVFAPYQINRAVMDLAGPDTVFMHCLPAHRGEEVTSEVADMPRSLIFEQAENRLHAQKAVLLSLLAGF
jgi:ornithine carbamoyltransferase